MEDTKTLVLSETLQTVEDQARFYISTPDRAGEALAFVKVLKELSSKIEESVKDRAWNIMQQNELREITYGNYVARIVEPTETKEYKVESVVAALGDNAFSLMKVNTSAMTTYLKKNKVEGDVLATLVSGMETKTRAGYITVSEKKDK